MSDIQSNVPLGPLTSFGIGGSAEFFARPTSIEELRTILAQGITPITILGDCTNVLIADSGIRGIVIVTSALSDIAIDNCTIHASCGARLIKIAKTAADAGLAGLEFASGIPGTLGGAICMNAGAFGGEIGNCIKTVQLLSPDGTLIQQSDMQFGYRTSNIGTNIVISAELTLTEADPNTIRTNIRLCHDQRLATQPMGKKSAGSIFKRPTGHFAAKLIDDCGLKGCCVGDAQVSTMHAGFIVNNGTASCNDVLQLIEIVRARVFERFGVELELEVKVLGI